MGSTPKCIVVSIASYPNEILAFSTKPFWSLGMHQSGNLGALFAPKSVAVIGASNRKGSVGRAVFTNILLNEYTGTVYPVNPKDRSISGVRSYPSIGDLPESVDVAVVVVPAAVVPAVTEECGKKGVKGLIIISAGFKEVREDPKTKVILLYIEDIVDGRKFVDTVSKVTEEKPIIAVKAGVSPEGAKAASSHTGALAGSDEAYNAILKQSGVLRVESIIDLFDYARAFAKQPLPRGNRVAIIT